MNKDFSKLIEEIDFKSSFLQQAFGNIGIDYTSKRIGKYTKKLENSLF